MINVVEVSSDSNIGGAGKCILTLLKTYDREKFNISVVLPRNSLLKPEVEALKVKVFEIDNLAEKSLSRKAVWRLRHLFNYLMPDIVHTHASMSARIAAKLCGIKVVYTRHSVFEPPKRISSGIGKLLNGFINNHTADRIIAVAEAAKENLVKTGVKADKIQVILNGVDALTPYTEEQIKKVKAEYGIGDGQKVAAIVARLNVVKGHKYFVEAARIIRDHEIDAKFLIAGTGEVEEELKKQISDYELEDVVIMLGFLEDVEPLMNILDVQVNCSFGTEATSLSLLEGMSLGKPAVVTEFGGNPGVIEDGKNGYLLPIHNPDDMAVKIEELFTDQQLYNTMKNNCTRIYNKKFTSKVNTRNIENVYIELFESSKKTVRRSK
ncbi:MAG: glycosyltransferase family 4 protein [Oscillospiraceae bacterium]